MCGEGANTRPGKWGAFRGRARVAAVQPLRRGEGAFRIQRGGIAPGCNRDGVAWRMWRGGEEASLRSTHRGKGGSAAGRIQCGGTAPGGQEAEVHGNKEEKDEEGLREVEMKDFRKFQDACGPSKQEADMHSLTHMPYRNFGRHCIRGAGNRWYVNLRMEA